MIDAPLGLRDRTMNGMSSVAHGKCHDGAPPARQRVPVVAPTCELRTCAAAALGCHCPTPPVGPVPKAVLTRATYSPPEVPSGTLTDAAAGQPAPRQPVRGIGNGPGDPTADKRLMCRSSAPSR